MDATPTPADVPPVSPAPSRAPSDATLFLTGAIPHLPDIGTNHRKKRTRADRRRGRQEKEGRNEEPEGRPAPTAPADPHQDRTDRDTARYLNWLSDHPDATADDWADAEAARTRALWPEPAADEELDWRHSYWWVRRRKVYAAMVAAGMSAARLERFTNCGTGATVCVHETTGETCVRATYCHDRWCDPCARAKALAIAENVQSRIEDGRHLHVVLTTRHNTLPLADQIDRIYRHFKKLRKHPLWQAAVTGGCAFLQVHPSHRDGLWHVHLHLVVSGHWLDSRELSAAWLAVTGDSDNVHVSAIADARAAARECSRYAAKPIDAGTIHHADLLAEVMSATTGRHLCLTFGAWRGKRLTHRDPDPDAKFFKPVCRLVELISRAQAGDSWAKHTLDALRRRAHRPTGPPELESFRRTLVPAADCTELGTPTP